MAEWSRTDISFAQRSYDVQHGIGSDMQIKLDMSTIAGNPNDDHLCGLDNVDLRLFQPSKTKNVLAK